MCRSQRLLGPAASAALGIAASKNESEFKVRHYGGKSTVLIGTAPVANPVMEHIPTNDIISDCPHKSIPTVGA